MRYPLFFKPTDTYSSRGVGNANDDVTLLEEAKNIKRAGTAIVEEFCEREEISVDVHVENEIARIHLPLISNTYI